MEKSRSRVFIDWGAGDVSVSLGEISPLGKITILVLWRMEVAHLRNLLGSRISATRPNGTYSGAANAFSALGGR